MKRRINLANTTDFVVAYRYGVFYSTIMLASVLFWIYLIGSRYGYANQYVFGLVIFYPVFVATMRHPFAKLVRYRYRWSLPSYDKDQKAAKYLADKKDEMVFHDDEKDWAFHFIYAEDFVKAKMSI